MNFAGSSRRARVESIIVRHKIPIEICYIDNVMMKLIQNFAQPLDVVEQDIPFAHDSVALRALDRRPVCFNNTVHFVDRRMQSPRGNKP